MILSRVLAACRAQVPLFRRSLRVRTSDGPHPLHLRSELDEDFKTRIPVRSVRRRVNRRAFHDASFRARYPETLTRHLLSYGDRVGSERGYEPAGRKPESGIEDGQPATKPHRTGEGSRLAPTPHAQPTHAPGPRTMTYAPDAAPRGECPRETPRPPPRSRARARGGHGGAPSAAPGHRHRPRRRRRAGCPWTTPRRTSAETTPKPSHRSRR